VEEPEQKALAFNSVVREVRALADPRHFAALLQQLPAGTRALVEQPPLPIEWLPYTHSWSLVRKAHEVCFDGDEQRTAEIGRRAVVNDLKLVHKMFIRLASPEFVERVAAGCVRVHYQGLRHATPLFWQVQAGTLRGLAEATGLAAVHIAIVDGKHSPSRCVVAVNW
jgi:hypothetical protein